MSEYHVVDHEWERRKTYLVRSLFDGSLSTIEDVTEESSSIEEVPEGLSTVEEETDESSTRAKDAAPTERRSNSSQTRDETPSPIPELIIEVEKKPTYDDSEEHYRKLEIVITALCKKYLSKPKNEKEYEAYMQMFVSNFRNLSTEDLCEIIYEANVTGANISPDLSEGVDNDELGNDEDHDYEVDSDEDVNDKIDDVEIDNNGVEYDEDDSEEDDHVKVDVEEVDNNGVDHDEDYNDKVDNDGVGDDKDDDDKFDNGEDDNKEVDNDEDGNEKFDDEEVDSNGVEDDKEVDSNVVDIAKGDNDKVYDDKFDNVGVSDDGGDDDKLNNGEDDNDEVTEEEVYNGEDDNEKVDGEEVDNNGVVDDNGNHGDDNDKVDNDGGDDDNVDHEEFDNYEEDSNDKLSGAGIHEEESEVLAKTTDVSPDTPASPDVRSPEVMRRRRNTSNDITVPIKKIKSLDSTTTPRIEVTQDIEPAITASMESEQGGSFSPSLSEAEELAANLTSEDVSPDTPASPDVRSPEVMRRRRNTSNDITVPIKKIKSLDSTTTPRIEVTQDIEPEITASMESEQGGSFSPSLSEAGELAANLTSEDVSTPASSKVQYPETMRRRRSDPNDITVPEKKRKSLQSAKSTLDIDEIHFDKHSKDESSTSLSDDITKAKTSESDTHSLISTGSNKSRSVTSHSSTSGTDDHSGTVDESERAGSNGGFRNILNSLFIGTPTIFKLCRCVDHVCE